MLLRVARRLLVARRNDRRPAGRSYSSIVLAPVLSKGFGSHFHCEVRREVLFAQLLDLRLNQRSLLDLLACVQSVTSGSRRTPPL